MNKLWILEDCGHKSLNKRFGLVQTRFKLGLDRTKPFIERFMTKSMPSHSNWFETVWSRFGTSKPETKPFGSGQEMAKPNGLNRFQFGSNPVWVGLRPNFPNTSRDRYHKKIVHQGTINRGAYATTALLKRV